MILKIFAVLIIIGVVLLVGQLLINRFSRDNEQLRKLVHVLHGSGLAALALIAPLDIVVAIEIFVLVSMLIARFLFSHFKNIAWIRYCGKVYNVGRVSYGEFFFPISAIILVFIAESKWEFAAAILILGIADAIAALIGKRFGKSNSYLVFGQNKSLAGSAAFFAATLLIVWGFATFHTGTANEVGLGLILLISILVTTAENLGVYGSDNLLIPVVAVFLLNRL